METLFKIDGVAIPVPYRGLEFPSMRFVSEARNNRGEVISQPIGRQIEKFNNLEWRKLTLSEWETILQYVQNFYSNVTYYSLYTRSIVTRKFYWGDVSYKVLFWQDAGQGLRKPKTFEFCKVNIIDVGE